MQVTSRRSVLARRTGGRPRILQDALLFGLLHLPLDVWVLVHVGERVRDRVVHFYLVADAVPECCVLPRLHLSCHVLDGIIAHVDELGLLRASFYEGLWLQVLVRCCVSGLAEATLDRGAVIQREFAAILSRLVVHVEADGARALSRL